MKNKLLYSRLEKDFEFFVNNLSELEPVEFVGLAKVLGVSIVQKDVVLDINKEELKQLSTEERQELAEKALRPMDEILEEMMDKFLSLSKRRRKEINQILKDIKHMNMNERKKKVKKNGVTT